MERAGPPPRPGMPSTCRLPPLSFDNNFSARDGQLLHRLHLDEESETRAPRNHKRQQHDGNARFAVATIGFCSAVGACRRVAHRRPRRVRVRPLLPDLRHPGATPARSSPTEQPPRSTPNGPTSSPRPEKETPMAIATQLMTDEQRKSVARGFHQRCSLGRRIGEARCWPRRGAVPMGRRGSAGKGGSRRSSAEWTRRAKMFCGPCRRRGGPSRSARGSRGAQRPPPRALALRRP
jgi:hypothetical protein